MWIIQPPVLDVHDDGDDVHDGVHVDVHDDDDVHDGVHVDVQPPVLNSFH